MIWTPWDQTSPAEQRRAQNALFRQGMLHFAMGHVPFVRQRLSRAGIDPRLLRGLEDLPRLPPVLPREVFELDANPGGPGALLLHGSEEGVKRFSDRSALWRVARARLLHGPEGQQAEIEAATRPVHLHLVPAGEGEIPVGYTFDDLRLLARAGARLGHVLGVERTDLVLNLIPFGATLEFWGTYYLCHGLGVTGLHARPRLRSLAASLAALGTAPRPTVVVLPAEEVVHFPAFAAEGGLDCGALRLVVGVGRSLSLEERRDTAIDLTNAGAGEARVAAVYAPPGGRVLWGECAVPPGGTETFGFHTYPDLEIVEILSPETGAPLPPERPGEITLTPLQFRGGGVPRWRSGDLALGGVTARPCPNCGRTLPRVGPSVVPRAWRREVRLNGTRRILDLRDLGTAVTGQAREWQLELVGGDGNGADELYVYMAPRAGEAEAVLGVWEALGRVEAEPTQIVLAGDEDLRARLAEAGGDWPRFWQR